MDRVEDLLTSLCAAWNDGNAAAFANCFAEDANGVGFDGSVLPGRSSIEAFYEEAFGGRFNGSRMTLRPLTPAGSGRPDIILARAMVRWPEIQKKPEYRSVQMFALDAGSALVTNFQETPDRPIRTAQDARIWKRFEQEWAARDRLAGWVMMPI